MVQRRPLLLFTHYALRTALYAYSSLVVFTMLL